MSEARERQQHYTQLYQNLPASAGSYLSSRVTDASLIPTDRGGIAVAADFKYTNAFQAATATVAEAQPRSGQSSAIEFHSHNSSSAFKGLWPPTFEVDYTHRSSANNPINTDLIQNTPSHYKVIPAHFNSKGKFSQTSIPPSSLLSSQKKVVRKEVANEFDRNSNNNSSSTSLLSRVQSEDEESFKAQMRIVKEIIERRSNNNNSSSSLSNHQGRLHDEEVQSENSNVNDYEHSSNIPRTAYFQKNKSSYSPIQLGSTVTAAASTHRSNAITSPQNIPSTPLSSAFNHPPLPTAFRGFKAPRIEEAYHFQSPPKTIKVNGGGSGSSCSKNNSSALSMQTANRVQSQSNNNNSSSQRAFADESNHPYHQLNQNSFAELLGAKTITREVKDSQAYLSAMRALQDRVKELEKQLANQILLRKLNEEFEEQFKSTQNQLTLTTKEANRLSSLVDDLSDQLQQAQRDQDELQTKCETFSDENKQLSHQLAEREEIFHHAVDMEKQQLADLNDQLQQIAHQLDATALQNQQLLNKLDQSQAVQLEADHKHQKETQTFKDEQLRQSNKISQLEALLASKEREIDEVKRSKEKDNELREIFQDQREAMFLQRLEEHFKLLSHHRLQQNTTPITSTNHNSSISHHTSPPLEQITSKQPSRQAVTHTAAAIPAEGESQHFVSQEESDLLNFDYDEMLLQSRLVSKSSPQLLQYSRQSKQNAASAQYSNSSLFRQSSDSPLRKFLPQTALTSSFRVESRGGGFLQAPQLSTPSATMFNIALPKRTEERSPGFGIGNSEISFNYGVVSPTTTVNGSALSSNAVMMSSIEKRAQMKQSEMSFNARRRQNEQATTMTVQGERNRFRGQGSRWEGSEQNLREENVGGDYQSNSIRASSSSAMAGVSNGQKRLSRETYASDGQVDIDNNVRHTSSSLPRAAGSITPPTEEEINRQVLLHQRHYSASGLTQSDKKFQVVDSARGLAITNALNVSANQSYTTGGNQAANAELIREIFEIEHELNLLNQRYEVLLTQSRVKE